MTVQLVPGGPDPITNGLGILSPFTHTERSGSPADAEARTEVARGLGIRRCSGEAVAGEVRSVSDSMVLACGVVGFRSSIRICGSITDEGEGKAFYNVVTKELLLGV
jgi:hypothetical protein